MTKKFQFKKRRKSYNPFKMWGSYIGALIGGMGIIFGSSFFLLFILFFPILILGGTLAFTLGRPGDPLIFIPLGIIYGFLIGWGIHSLFRKFN